jgi:hypothetical protein
MRPVAMECPVCKVEIRGQFRQTFFQMLSGEERQLLEDYLLADFSIKDMAASSGLGYAAIRSRLDRLIEHYRALRNGEEAQKAILQQVAEGKISAAEAARRISELRSNL